MQALGCDIQYFLTVDNSKKKKEKKRKKEKASFPVPFLTLQKLTCLIHFSCTGLALTTCLSRIKQALLHVFDAWYK